MSGDIIKSFLVGLGFDVDGASLAKFSKAITSATLKVATLAGSIQTAVAGIFYGITKISQNFEDLGYSLRLIAPSVNKMLLLREAMLTAYSKAGINLVKVVKQSILFNYSLARTKFALEAIYKSVGARFLPVLTKQMNIFRGQIFANMPKIQNLLEKFIKFLFKAFEATIQLGTRVWSILGRVYDFFKDLDKATDGWSTRIFGFIAVWKLLNLSFLATPLGRILTGLIAILALYDDFKVWQEGGKSFFNWKAALPIINEIKAAVSSFAGMWSNLVDAVLDVVLGFQQLFSGDYGSVLGTWAEAGEKLIGVFSRLWDVLKNLSLAFAGTASLLGSKIASWLGSNPSVAANVTHSAAHNAQANLANIATPTPLVNQNHAGVNQRVSQENNILIQGSADAHSTGRAVASEQSKLNFDLARNLRSRYQ